MHRTVAIAALLLCGPFAGDRALPSAAWAATPPPASPPAGRAWTIRQTPVVEVVRRVKDAVVNIHSERLGGLGSSGAGQLGRTPDELFSHTPSASRVNGMGTGIVIDPRGYLITNCHVVDDVSSLRVRLCDGTTLAARVLDRDATTDLALVKISPPRPLAVMPLGTARDLQVGETVVAIGNAYGYDHTVTVGVVSALGRDVTLNREVRYRALIQTDASINPGNSGGPLVNLLGELVGVNVAIRAGAQGIGFAIPVDTMVKVASEMLARQARISPASLGLGLRDEVRLPAVTGPARREVVLARVEPQSAAARAGLRAGDLLAAVSGVPAASSLDLHRALLEATPGNKLALTVERAGLQKRVELALEAPRAAALVSASKGRSTEPIWQRLGIRQRPLASHEIEALTRTHAQLHGGLMVLETRPGSPAAQAGFRAGDVLIGLHQWEMLSAENVLFVLDHEQRSTFSPLRYHLLRANRLLQGTLSGLE
jgi:serine protease Do